MKSGSVSFYLGIIFLIAGIAAAAMGYPAGIAVGIIFFAMGGMGRLFENEVIDCLLLTFVGVAGLVFVLNYGETHFGSHNAGHEVAHESATTAAPEHK